MAYLSEQLFNYITTGEIKQFYIVLFNQYIPYGIFFWMVGAIMMLITHNKTHNLAYAVFIASVYFVALPVTGLIVSVYSMTMMKYFGLIIGVVSGYYIYRAVKG